MTPANWLSMLTNHLWQSTAFAAVIWLLALALRRNQARTRHWLWLIASIKFLIPFALFVTIGAYWSAKMPVAIATQHIPAVAAEIAQPFPENAPAGPFVAAPAAHNAHSPLLILLGIWACGFVGITFYWWLRWRRVRAAAGSASPLPLSATVPVLNSPSSLEPGVFGIFRPVLLLPRGIAERLTPEQLNAVIAHEMAHVRRRDNLAAAIHMAVEAIFWFHPIVWWIGARMLEERERACDEEVVKLGGQREAYAEGILSVCKYYLESPVACVSGISGSDLKKRIVRIMTEHGTAKLTLARKVALTALAFATIAGPLFFGIVNAALARARQESGTSLPSFEVASIKEDNSGTRGRLFQMPSPGHFHTINMPTNNLIQFAYNIKAFQISGAPSWTESQGYVIDAKVDDALMPEFLKLNRREQMDQMRLMLRSLLADRFQLTLSRETKDAPIYALVVAKGGPKLTPTTWVEPEAGATPPSAPQRNGPHLMISPTGMSAVNQPASALADILAVLPELNGRFVQDQTGIKGNYDFEIKFTPQGLGPKGQAPPDAQASTDDSVSIFTALQEQLGLRLESTHGPVDMYTVTRIERPSQD